MKKPLEISMRSNGFRDLKQSLVLAVQEIRLLPLNGLVVHGFESIRSSMAIQDTRSGTAPSASGRSGFCASAPHVISYKGERFNPDSAVEK